MLTDTTNGENSTVDVKVVCRVETVGGGSTTTKLMAEGNVGLHLQLDQLFGLVEQMVFLITLVVMEQL